MNEHFNNSFWSPSMDPIPNYAHGLNVLHDRLLKSVQENKDITKYLQQRIDTENQCAQILGSNTNKISMMNASLNSAFDMVYYESIESSHCHHVRAGLLSQDVLEPLDNFTRWFESQLNLEKTRLNQDIEEFQHAAQSALLTRSVYWSKCHALELACPDYRPPVPEGFEEQEEEDGDFIGTRKRSSSVTSELNVDTGGVRLGQYTILPYREVARSMGRMQKMIPSIKPNQQSPCHFLGKHIFEWTRDYITSPPTSIQSNEKNLTLDTETLEICQHLVALKFLKSVPKETIGFDLEKYYEIQQNVVERYLRKTRIRHTSDDQHQQVTNNNENNMTLEVPSSTSMHGSVGVIGGLFDRLKKNTITKAHIEMKEADTVYKNKVNEVEKMRRVLEENLVTHFNNMEALEKERIEKIKHAFVTMSNALSNTLSMYKETYDRIILFQEALEPEQDIHCIIEQYRTGPFCPKPMIYENYYYGAAVNQIFGVPLEEVAQMYGSYVPPIVSKGIKLIDASLSVTNDYEKSCKDIWLKHISVNEMNDICEQLNALVGNQLKNVLDTFDLNVLANLIRVYLLELPECLLTFDLYDPMKLLYATQQDTSSRLMSISKLLATLPSVNYHTLKVLSHHLFKLLNQATTDTMLNQLISTFSYILIRPRIYLPIHMHDRHPKKLVRDLFTQYTVIFTKDMNQAQKSGASRSAIVVNVTSKDDPVHLIIPPRQHTLFEDPDTSQPTTPRASITGDSISTDQSILFDMSDQDDAVEIMDKLNITRTPNRSRASTRGTMDNIVLDSFFDD